jgi:hypothetical protein
VGAVVRRERPSDVAADQVDDVQVGGGGRVGHDGDVDVPAVEAPVHDGTQMAEERRRWEEVRVVEVDDALAPVRSSATADALQGLPPDGVDRPPGFPLPPVLDAVSPHPLGWRLTPVKVDVLEVVDLGARIDRELGTASNRGGWPVGHPVGFRAGPEALGLTLEPPLEVSPSSQGGLVTAAVGALLPARAQMLAGEICVRRRGEGVVRRVTTHVVERGGHGGELPERLERPRQSGVGVSQLALDVGVPEQVPPDEGRLCHVIGVLDVAAAQH